jgi:hypothetical protein
MRCCRTFICKHVSGKRIKARFPGLVTWKSTLATSLMAFMAWGTITVKDLWNSGRFDKYLTRMASGVKVGRFCVR